MMSAEVGTGGVGVTSGAAISVRGVSKRFVRSGSAVDALDDVSFDVAPGAFVSLIGRSGCGKTTMLRIMAGLEEPSRGRIEVEGGGAGAASNGIVFQAPTLLPWRSVADNVQLSERLGPRRRARRSAADVRRRTEELLKLVSLTGFESALPAELSGGMQQRVAIARALFADPGVLYMDEPFAALDALTREQMVMELHRLWQSTRKTVIFVTHDITEALLLSTDVIVLSARPGRVAHRMRVDLPEERTLELRRDPRFQDYERFLHDALGHGGGVQGDNQ